MSFLVHKITSSLWADQSKDIISIEHYKELSADGVTQDLKSSNNAISFWEIEDLSELNDISISILTGRDEVKDLTVVAIPKSTIVEHFEIEQSEGDTLYLKYKNKHYDLINMNYEKLGSLIKLIIDAISEENTYYDMIFNQEGEYIWQLVESKKIQIDNPKSKLLKKLTQYHSNQSI